MNGAAVASAALNVRGWRRVQLLPFSASVSLLVTHGVLLSAAATLALMLAEPTAVCLFHVTTGA
jgi:hypothetical protein